MFIAEADTDGVQGVQLNLDNSAVFIAGADPDGV